MIRFGKADVTCKVVDLPIANFHQRRSNLLVAISPLPIFMKNIRPSGGKICHYVKDHGPVLVAQSVLVAPSVLMQRLMVMCRRKAFRVQLVSLGSR